jgi:hypothetical protein
MENIRSTFTFLVEKHEGMRPLARPWIHGRITLKWILEKQGERVSNGYIWLWIGIGGGLV